jgi:hypothetical protein
MFSNPAGAVCGAIDGQRAARFRRGTRPQATS